MGIVFATGSLPGNLWIPDAIKAADEGKVPVSSSRIQIDGNEDSV